MIFQGKASLAFLTPMMRGRAAAMVLALAVAGPAMAVPASLQTPQSSPQSPSQSTLQPSSRAVQQVPGAAPPAQPKDAQPDAKRDHPRPPQKGDMLVALNWSLLLNNVSNGEDVEVGFDRVLGDGLELGMLAGKKWMDYDAQYANIAMHSSGLYLTLSRSLSDGLLVQLRGGAVEEFYSGLQGPKPADFLPQPTPNGRGGAVGVSLVATFDHVNHGVFGWERQYIGGCTSDVFSISWVVIGGVEMGIILH